MDSDSESEFSDQEAKEGQVQEVVSEDQEELVVDAGVEDETLMEDTVLTPQRNNQIECDSEHSRSCSCSEARSEVDLLGSDAKEEAKKEEENCNDQVRDKEDHDENEKLVTGTDPEPNQTLQPKNVEVECANMEAATEAKSTWRELKSCFFQIHY